MDKKNLTKILVAVVGAGVLYFVYKKITEEKEGAETPGEDIPTDIPVTRVDAVVQDDPSKDNPTTGTYQGDKPRSQGNSRTTTTLAPNRDGFSLCIPAMESEGGGKGKYISVDDPHTPGQVEADRRQILHDNLQVGQTIDLDGRSCQIKKMWMDSSNRNSAIQCEDHSNITYDENSSICW